MIKMSSNKLGYCHVCALNSIVSKKGMLHGIPVYRYWCKGPCGESFIKPVKMTDLPELHERIEHSKEDRKRQAPLPLT